MLTDEETYETDEFMIVDSLEIVLVKDSDEGDQNISVPWTLIEYSED